MTGVDTSNWKRVALGDAIELAYGKNLPKGDRRQGAVPVYGSNGVTGWHDTALVREPTVVIGRKGSAGAVHLVDQPCFPIDTTYFTRVRNGFEFDNRFLAYMLKRSNLARLSTSTGVPGLAREDAYREPISVPSITEQARIADLLSRAENIVWMRREAEAKAKEIIPALFVDGFGEPVGLQEGRREAEPFGNLGTLDRGKSRHRPRDAAHLYGGTVPFIQTGDVSQSDGIIDSYTQTYSVAGVSQSRVWKAGTLCITIAANIANTGVLSFDACFPDSVVGFVPGPKVRTEFIQTWLGFLRPTLEAQAPQAAQKNINLEILRKLQVAIPPLGDQDRFCHQVASVRSLQKSNRRATDQADQVFQSLLAGVFGEGR